MYLLCAAATTEKRVRCVSPLVGSSRRLKESIYYPFLIEFLELFRKFWKVLGSLGALKIFVFPFWLLGGVVL
jgi:hypothetical protein